MKLRAHGVVGEGGVLGEESSGSEGEGGGGGEEGSAGGLRGSGVHWLSLRVERVRFVRAQDGLGLQAA